MRKIAKKEAEYPGKEKVDFENAPIGEICEAMDFLDKNFKLEYESEIKEDL